MYKQRKGFLAWLAIIFFSCALGASYLSSQKLLFAKKWQLSYALDLEKKLLRQRIAILTTKLALFPPLKAVKPNGKAMRK